MRTRQRWERGFSLVELVVVIVVIGILAAVMLRAYADYAERAERAAMERVVSAIRAALHMRVAGLLVRGADEAIVQLADQNPMDWLTDRPHHYAGSFAGTAPPEFVSAPSWYFDSQARELVYRPLRTRHLLTPVNPYHDIRFRIWVDQGELPGGEMLAEPLRGVRRMEFGPVEPYQWTINSH